jgi:penicillin-binding protein 1C
MADSGRRYVLRAVDDQGRAESREVTVDIAP